jgi:hypothetical protein
MVTRTDGKLVYNRAHGESERVAWRVANSLTYLFPFEYQA